MTTTKVAYELKKIYGRKFRSSELNEHAKKLGLLECYNFGNLSYRWSDEDVELLKKIIES